MRLSVQLAVLILDKRKMTKIIQYDEKRKEKKKEGKKENAERTRVLNKLSQPPDVYMTVNADRLNN